MKNHLSRRSVIGRISAAVAGVLAAPVAKAAKAVTQKLLDSTDAPKNYDPTKHKWVMAVDANRCIGCGFCAEA
jgi:ferredoxin